MVARCARVRARVRCLCVRRLPVPVAVQRCRLLGPCLLALEPWTLVVGILLGVGAIHVYVPYLPCQRRTSAALSDLSQTLTHALTLRQTARPSCHRPRPFWPQIPCDTCTCVDYILDRPLGGALGAGGGDNIGLDRQ